VPNECFSYLQCHLFSPAGSFFYLFGSSIFNFLGSLLSSLLRVSFFFSFSSAPYPKVITKGYFTLVFESFCSPLSNSFSFTASLNSLCPRFLPGFALGLCSFSLSSDVLFLPCIPLSAQLNIIPHCKRQQQQRTMITEYKSWRLNWKRCHRYVWLKIVHYDVLQKGMRRYLERKGKQGQAMVMKQYRV